MPQNITTYQVLISCPGDIKEEINAIEDAVELFNQQYSGVLSIAIQTRHWSKSSYPQSGNKPQALLNKQFVESCDAAIAIMWTRFGIPTDEYGSGTEEEIENMLCSGKQVFMYFSDVPVSPSLCNSDEYKRIQAFKMHYKDLGLYHQYSSLDDFKKQIFAHLSAYFLSLKQVEKETNKNIPLLCLRGINENDHIVEYAHVHHLNPQKIKSLSNDIEKIKELYKQINTSNVGKRPVSSRYGATSLATSITFYEPVIIKESTRKLLQEIARKMDIELSENFFEIGSLEKNTINVSFMGGEAYKGTDEEKEKYINIRKLENTIYDMTAWAPAENLLSKLLVIKLCISNEGKAFDEDVELTLILPKCAFRTINQFPTFEGDTLELLCEESLLKQIVTLNETAFYKDYESSRRKTIATTNPPVYSRRFVYTPTAQERYKECLSDLFCYSIFEENDNYLIKINFDYIKQHSSVALPTPIFVHHPIKYIKYKITSKRNPDIVNGEIIVYS